MLGGGSLLGGVAGIQSVQYGTIAFTTVQASNTAAINPVVLANSVVIPLGDSFAAIGDVWDVVGLKVVLTSNVLVTASRFAQNGVGTPTISFMVIEFTTGAIKSNQDFDVTMNLVNTNTAVLGTAVTVAKTVIIPRGWTFDSGVADSITGAGTLIKTLGKMTLTDATTITGTRGSALAKLILSGTALEFN